MLKPFLYISLCIAFVNSASAQKKYVASDIHSHNDYSRPEAFYHAFNAGAGAIEADVYLRNGRLVVAHDTTAAKQQLSFNKMYLQPFLKEFKARPRPLNLVIDLKEAYAPILAELLKELKPLKSLIKSGNNNKTLSIIITGNRPPPALYNKYPTYITFDDDLQLPHTSEQWKRVAQVSLNFENYSKWQGEGMLPPVDEKVLKSIINAVHASGKRIRFWAAPDNKAGWQKLMELKADILSTDKIDELKELLKKPGN
jgi:glycerophosphoryl diester phosphodiesterase